MGDFNQGKMKKLIAKIFGIKTVVVRKVEYTVRDREFTAEEMRAISDFLNTPAGRQLCDFLLAQKLAVADSASRMFGKGDFWQGYACGFKAAVENFLTFRQPDGNGELPGDSGEVGLEELAEKLDQTER